MRRTVNLLVAGLGVAIAVALSACASSSSSKEPIQSASSSPAPTIQPSEQANTHTVIPLDTAAESSADQSTEKPTSVDEPQLAKLELTGIEYSPANSAESFQVNYVADWIEKNARGSPLQATLIIKMVGSSEPPWRIKTSITPGKNKLMLPAPNGISCELDYEVAIETSGIKSNQLKLHIPEPELADRLLCLKFAAAGLPLLGNDASYQDWLAVPRGSTKIYLEFRDDAQKTIFATKAIAAQVFEDFGIWNMAKVSLLLPENLKEGSWQRWYRFSYASGLLSSWQSAGRLTLGPIDQIQAIEPCENDYTLVSAPVFRWQALSNPPDAQLYLSPVAPGTSNFKPDGVARVAIRNGTGVGDLRRFLPGLKQDDNFWWQIRHSAGLPATTWQRAIFDTSLDEFAQVLAPDQVKRFPMGSRQGPPDQQPLREIELRQPFSMLRLAVSNTIFSRIANNMLRQAWLIIKGSNLVETDNARIIAGLGKLDYGDQFGLSENPRGRIAVRPGHEDHPVIGVSWYGVDLIRRYLDIRAGLSAQNGFRLPSEAEWEFVASQGQGLATPWSTKAGTSTANFLRSGDRFEDPLPPYTRKNGPTVPVDWYASTRSAAMRTATTGINGKALSPEIARLQLIGNVWEWCTDWYLPTGFDPADIQDPQGPLTLTAEQEKSLTVLGQRPSRVVKGGAWNSEANELYAQNRGKYPPDRTSFSIGFRLVRSGN